MNRAQEIIASAARDVAGINDPRDRLARQVGILQGEIRALCAELEPPPPSRSAHLIGRANHEL